MSFDDLMTDRVSVLKADGTCFDNIPASVQSKKVFINQATPLIEPGDLLVRKMSNGAEETMRVIDPGFHEQFHGIPAGYQMTVEKLGLPEAKRAVQSITYNVHGNNARINHQSVDNSTNVVQVQGDAARLLDELRRTINSIEIPSNEKKEAMEIVEAVGDQFSNGVPRRSVVKAMLSTLPDIVTIATTVKAIIDLTS